jgi:hypothetical protein
MTTPRHALAVSLAAATLAVLLAVIAMGGALRAGLAPWPGIAVVATTFLAAATFPGPVFGVIIGLPVLALGVVKGVETARARSR